ncbi:VOC family protein [Pseudomonas sp. TTU2014-080ASC]|uniref:VOC family protein n=1 Tax=Pseudomonas sp. TTU2014-080ASC TaxID=1729724 RepID=UPI00071888AB|nr:VOC family protein [Pseudomonas sp. TTU2014-080ASC]KRW62756.1 glyoxalase [Pseudomonas sp. TTU2014-080ASC]
MADLNPCILSHISIGTNQFEKAAAFYDQVLATLDCTRIMSHPGAIAYGKLYPEFWLQIPADGKPASIGNGYHVAFQADSREAVDRFYAAALAAGAQDDGPPGPRPDYGAPYYGCFVRDLDGHKIEATYWDMALGDTLANEPHQH